MIELCLLLTQPRMEDSKADYHQGKDAIRSNLGSRFVKMLCFLIGTRAFNWAAPTHSGGF